MGGNDGFHAAVLGLFWLNMTIAKPLTKTPTIQLRKTLHSYMKGVAMEDFALTPLHIAYQISYKKFQQVVDKTWTIDPKFYSSTGLRQSPIHWYDPLIHSWCLAALYRIHVVTFRVVLYSDGTRGIFKWHIQQFHGNNSNVNVTNEDTDPFELEYRGHTSPDEFIKSCGYIRHTSSTMYLMHVTDKRTSLEEYEEDSYNSDDNNDPQNVFYLHLFPKETEMFGTVSQQKKGNLQRTKNCLPTILWRLQRDTSFSTRSMAATIALGTGYS